MLAMILCCGESLIDFIPTETRGGEPGYRPANGGSIHNVALGLGRLAVPVGFVGGISTDFFGEGLAEGMIADGVSLSHVSRLDRPTTLAFVRFTGSDARYAFFDAEAADRHWQLGHMPPIPPEVTALHFGCISLLRQPAADDFTTLMSREAPRRVIGFDANIRPNMVGKHNEREYRDRLNLFFRNAHIIKVSDADLDWVAPGADPAEFAAEWLGAEARLVLLTRGGEGAILFARGTKVSRPALPVKVADTVGAGDSFMAGLLAALYDRNRLATAALDAISEGDLTAILEYALAVAAVTVSRVGANPPRRAELEELLAQRR